MNYHFRIHHDDAAAVHQLQAEVRGTPSVAHADVQGPEHLHRRHLRLRHQDANHVQDRMLQGRHRLLHLSLSAIHLQGNIFLLFYFITTFLIKLCFNLMKFISSV